MTIRAGPCATSSLHLSSLPLLWSSPRLSGQGAGARPSPRLSLNCIILTMGGSGWSHGQEVDVGHFRDSSFFNHIL
jgi:hypothetical protein